MKAPEARSASTPRVPQLHLVDTPQGAHLLVVDGTRLYEVGPRIAAALARADLDPERAEQVLAELGLEPDAFVTDAPLAAPAPRALSLSIAGKGELGCPCPGAREGSSGAGELMPLTTALAAVDLLLRHAKVGEPVSLAFLGAEPLANRAVLQAATERAAVLAREQGVAIRFALSTRAHGLTAEDVAFLERHAFEVMVALDARREEGALGALADALTPARPLLQPGLTRMRVTARVAVGPRSTGLRAVLDGLLAQGFRGVGFAPVLAPLPGREGLEPGDLDPLLEELIACGDELLQRVGEGERYPFLNLVHALGQIHRGAHRPYPCDAGGAYLGVSAGGGLFACHRFVGEEKGALGSVLGGIDRPRQARWLANRHVHRQEPCRSCWARYLCGGGCHHEVLRRGRPACDYLRGWLHYCVQAYVQLQATRPGWFEGE